MRTKVGNSMCIVHNIIFPKKDKRIVTIFGVRVVESILEVLLMTKNLLAEEISRSNKHLQQR